MKKEVIYVQDGKQFKEEIEKILKQAKGKELYIDDELASDLKSIGNCVNDKIILNGNNRREHGYTIFMEEVNNRFYKIKMVISFMNEKYKIPDESYKAILILLA